MHVYAIINKMIRVPSRLRGPLAAEVNNSGDPLLTQERREAISLMPFARGLAALVLHDIVRISPDAAQKALRAPYVQRGHELIGYGAEADVIKIDDFVLKILRRSERLSPAEQQDFAKRHTELQNIFIESVPGVPIAHTFDVGQHPLKSRATVTVARQPFAEGFSPITTRDLPQLERLNTLQSAQIASFVDKSIHMHEQTGYTPDIIGFNNVGFQDDNLRMVDTIPLSPLKDGMWYDRNLRLLERVGQAVR